MLYQKQQENILINEILRFNINNFGIINEYGGNSKGKP